MCGCAGSAAATQHVWAATRVEGSNSCCDMPRDCLSKHHGQASRDALRAWASTMIHGPRYEPDYGPCYASGRGPRRTSDQPPRDLRTNGRTTPILATGRTVVRPGDTRDWKDRWTSRPRAPGVIQPDPCTVRWDYARGSDSGCWSLLHTAGPDNSGRVIRLHLLGQGPAAILGSGPGLGREDQRGPTRDGTGRRRRLRRAEP